MVEFWFIILRTVGSRGFFGLQTVRSELASSLGQIAGDLVHAIHCGSDGRLVCHRSFSTRSTPNAGASAGQTANKP